MDELLEKKKYDRTYVEIDLEAIKHNIRCEREKVGDKVKLWQSSKQMLTVMAISKSQRH